MARYGRTRTNHSSALKSLAEKERCFPSYLGLGVVVGLLQPSLWLGALMNSLLQVLVTAAAADHVFLQFSIIEDSPC